MKKLGFGLMRLPQGDKNDPKSIDMAKLSQMADLFMERGFTYFDTAYMYHSGASENAFKKAVADRYPRGSFLVADKLPPFYLKSERDNERIFFDQLEKCGVEYFDYYLLHSLTKENYETAKKFGSFSFLSRMKEQGKIRRLGFSFHDSAEVLDVILSEHPEMEFVQLQINYLDWDDLLVQSGSCYEVARKHGTDIIIMEPLKGGRLAKAPQNAEKLIDLQQQVITPASLALRFGAGLEGVIMTLSGMSDLAQIDENTRIFDSPEPLAGTEKDALAEAVSCHIDGNLIGCTGCNYCVDGCPAAIAIPEVFKTYNEYVSSRSEQSIFKAYTQINPGAADCIFCGACSQICPQRLEVSELLLSVAKRFREDE